MNKFLIIIGACLSLLALGYWYNWGGICWAKKRYLPDAFYVARAKHLLLNEQLYDYAINSRIFRDNYPNMALFDKVNGDCCKVTRHLALFSYTIEVSIDDYPIDFHGQIGKYGTEIVLSPCGSLLSHGTTPAGGFRSDDELMQKIRNGEAR